MEFGLSLNLCFAMVISLDLSHTPVIDRHYVQVIFGFDDIYFDYFILCLIVKQAIFAFVKSRSNQFLEPTSTKQ